MANTCEYMQSILVGIGHLRRRFPDDKMPDALARDLEHVDSAIWDIIEVADDPKLMAELEEGDD